MYTTIRAASYGNRQRQGKVHFLFKKGMQIYNSIREEREREREIVKRFVVGAEMYKRSPSPSVKRNDQWRTTDAGPGPYFLKSKGEGNPQPLQIVSSQTRLIYI